MQNILKEPLLHFLLIGALLFVVFGQANDDSSITDNQITVSAGRIDQLSNIFTKTWQRPPTSNELKGMVDDFVLEEIYYRQAVAMGIDRDDTVIRRRLRQKFEFLTDDIASARMPTDEELSAYLAANQEDFKLDSTYTFEQVYINPDRPDFASGANVEERLAALRAGEDAGGDPGLLPVYFDAASGRAVDGSFGNGFAQSLDAIPVGDWHGPVESGLGIHLIKIYARVDGVVPDLAEIRPIVEREWSNQVRLDTRSTINDQLLEKYEVAIEWPTDQAANIVQSP